MRIERLNAENRQEANCFLEERWLSTALVIRGELIDASKAEGFAIYENGGIAGLLTYRRLPNDTLELLSLDSILEKKGIGSALLDTILTYARETDCKTIVAYTTNDNCNALRFAQKRGFDIAAVYPDSIKSARALKPDIPRVGYNGIPISSEIKLVCNI